MQIYAEMTKEDIIEAINTYLSKNITLNSNECFVFDDTNIKSFRVEIGTKKKRVEEKKEEIPPEVSMPLDDDEEEKPPFDPYPAEETPEPHKKNLFGGLANLK